MSEVFEISGFMVFSLLNEGEPVGYVVIREFCGLVYLFLIAIPKKYRRQGYGSKTIGRFKTIFEGMPIVLDYE